MSTGLAFQELECLRLLDGLAFQELECLRLLDGLAMNCERPKGEEEPGLYYLWTMLVSSLMASCQHFIVMYFISA